jgi:flagellar L-ring protein FlgH
VDERIPKKARLIAALVLLGTGGWGEPGLAQPGSLYADLKAGKIGDALTVIILENASATNQTATNTDKSNQLEISSQIPGGSNVLGFVPLHALQSQTANQYNGEASTSRSASLSARLTVTVVGMKPNGDLLIDGVRKMKINGETEVIHLSGSVSPAFVSRDNTVLSSSIADLQVDYTGNGTVTRGARPGVVVRFINWIF